MYEGVEVNLLTRPGPVIAGRLEERGREYQEMTGAKINVSSVPFADLFQKLLTDWATGTNSIDVGVFASGWAVELVDGGLLADLSDFVAKDDEAQDRRRRALLPRVQPEDRRQDLSDHDRWRLSDGLLPHRRAGRARPASRRKTWDEYLEIAAAAHGKDMNGDGEADFGSCMFKKRNAQSFYAIMTIAAPYVQSKGTGQGIFFDTEDMTPMVNNEAWAKAFEFYEESGKYGPPDELNHDIGDTRAAGDERPLRAGDRLGRHRPAVDRRDDLQGQGQGRRGDVAGLDPGARLGDRRAGRLHARALPLRRSTASTTRRSRRSAAGRARSTPTPTPR